MTVLILVLSARTQPWGSLMDCSMETWDAKPNEQTKTLYYCGKSSSGDRFDHMLGWRQMFYSDLSEDLWNVSPRTIEAFEKSLVADWDYLARPNSSCYVHKRNLVEYCETLPKENVISGILSDGIEPFMWGGCQYIFSRDVIEKMVARKERWNPHVMDDQSITAMINDLEIPLESKGHCASIDFHPENGSYTCLTYGVGQSFSFTDWSDINKAQPHYFFRVKQDFNRSLDCEIMRQLKLNYT